MALTSVKNVRVLVRWPVRFSDDQFMLNGTIEFFGLAEGSIWSMGKAAVEIRSLFKAAGEATMDAVFLVVVTMGGPQDLFSADYAKVKLYSHPYSVIPSSITIIFLDRFNEEVTRESWETTGKPYLSLVDTTIYLADIAMVTGVVYNQVSGNGLPATVTLGSRSAITARDGSFDFGAVPSGTYTLSAKSSGYVEYLAEVDLRLSQKYHFRVPMQDLAVLETLSAEELGVASQVTPSELQSYILSLVAAREQQGAMLRTEYESWYPSTLPPTSPPTSPPTLPPAAREQQGTMVIIERVLGGIRLIARNDTGQTIQGGFNTFVDGAIVKTHAPWEALGLIAPGEIKSTVAPLTAWYSGQAPAGEHSLSVQFLALNPQVPFGQGLPGEFIVPEEASNTVQVDFYATPWGLLLSLGLVAGLVVVATKRSRRTQNRRRR